MRFQTISLGLLVILGINLLQFKRCTAVDINVNITCDTNCSMEGIVVTDNDEKLAVYSSSCESCKLSVNTTSKDRIRLDLDSIDWPSYIVHDDVGTIFPEYLFYPCYIIFSTSELEIYMYRHSGFSIRTAATNQDSLDVSTNTNIDTNCEGLVHFDPPKNKPDVNVDLICYDQNCNRDEIITEIGDLITVHSNCELCKLAVNTTRRNLIRLDFVRFNWGSYIVHDGVGTIFAFYSSCYIIFPTSELEIYMDWYSKVSIRTAATNQDRLDASTNTNIDTNCEGLVHFDPENKPDVNVDLICSDQAWDTTLTEIGDLITVHSFYCKPCKLTVNTTRRNLIRLYITPIELPVSRSYIIHYGVGTLFTKLASCYIIFPTSELEIYMHGYTDAAFRIGIEEINQDSLDIATNTNTTIVTDCEGLFHVVSDKGVDDKIDVVCQSCRGDFHDTVIVTEVDDLRVVHGTCIGVPEPVCKLTVNTTSQKDIRFNIISIELQFSIIHDKVYTQFTENPGTCYITFRTNELVVYFAQNMAIDLIISTEETNQVSSHWNNTSDCSGLVHFKREEVHVIKYVELETYTENNYKEIQSYIRHSYKTHELKGVLPPCPYNCTCSFHYQQLIAHCDNNTNRAALFHDVKISVNISITLNASKRQLEIINERAFEDLKFINRLVLNKNLLTHIESTTFSSLQNLIILEIADNMINELESDIFTGLTQLSVLDLHGNKLTRIPSSAFHTSPSVKANLLGALDMSNNNLGEIPPETFEFEDHSIKLNILILDKNNITTLYPNTFRNVLNLTLLFLDDNQLTKISPNTFPSGLQRLHLSGNQLSEINSNVFQTPQFGVHENKLHELTLSKNGITVLSQDVFCYTPNLQRLSIADNQLHNIDLKPFANLKQLAFLNISKNNLKSVLHGISQENRWNFCNNTDKRSIAHLLQNMQVIDLNNNEIKTIKGDFFNEMPIIGTILIRGNPLQMVDKKTFASLKNYTNVLVDDPATCCFIEEAKCQPKKPKSPYLTCYQLLPYDSIKVFTWIFGLFALAGNLFVLIWRFMEHGRESNVQVLLIKNLAASDLMMGVYMLIIASADAYYQQYFPSWSNVWRNGPLCKLAGTLSVLSSEASVFLITLISIDRFLVIKYPHRKWRLTKRSTLKVLMCLWSLALLLSVLPVSFSGWKHEFYDVSEVCIGLPFARAPTYLNKTFQSEVKSFSNVHINIPDRLFRNILYDYGSILPAFPDYSSFTYHYSTGIEYEDTYTHVDEGNNPGLYFSIVLFLGINLACFLVVAVTYIWIFIIIVKHNRIMGIHRTDQEITLAKRMGAIIITDFMCWAPIIVIGILVQSAIVTIHPVVYVYIVVFLLPINSALNPYIYTIAFLLSNYWTRTRSNDNKKAQCHTKNRKGITRAANAEKKRKHSERRKDLTNKKTENVLKLTPIAFSHQPMSPDTGKRSDVENIGLTNNKAENTPKLELAQSSNQPKSPGTEARSDIEDYVGLANKKTENVPKLELDPSSYQSKSPETETKSDAVNNIGLVNSGTQNVTKVSPTSSSRQPKNTETET